MQIFVQLPTGKRITLDVDASTSIYTVKLRIQEKTTFVADEQRLIRDSTRWFAESVVELNDGKTCDQCNIEEGDTLYLRRRSIITIIVRDLDGNGHDVDVKTSDTTDDLKAKLFEMFGTPIDEQRLVSYGRRLVPGEKLSCKEWDEVCMMYKVKVQTFSTEFEIEVEANNSLVEVKSMLSETGEFLIPLSEIRLSRRGEELLPDCATLAELGVRGGAIQMLRVRQTSD